MSLKVELLADEDMLRAFTIMSDAFGTEHEYTNQVFPEHTTSVGREVGAKRYLGIKHSDPNTTFIKVTDETGLIIGMARWNVYDGVTPPEDRIGTKEFWHDEASADYADALVNRYSENRREAIQETGGHLCALDLLVVDPEHHRRGAGQMLIRWGTSIADKMNVKATVESSDYGKALYERCGFKFIKSVTVEPPEAFKHRPRQKYHWMVRPKSNGTKLI